LAAATGETSLSSPSIICRSLGPQDREAFERFRAAFSTEDRRHFTFLNQRPFEELLDPKRFWVVRCLPQGENIVGYGHLERFGQLEKAHVARLGIIVSSQVRGHGLGKELMNDLLEAARDLGLAKVWLSVHRDNTRAIRLFESVGFRCEGFFEDEERDFTGSRDIVAMSWLPHRVSREETRIHIPWSRPAIQTEEIVEVIKVLQSGWITQGRITESFEKALAAYLGARHVVAFNNGTSALLAAYRATFRPGDKVLFPAYTFVSTLNTAMLCGVEPVLIDSEADTANVDLNQAEETLRRVPGIRGLVVVDIAGLPCDTARCRTLSERFGVSLVEDAAQALGATVRGSRRIGSFGHLTIFSFHATKLLTSGEGGAVATDDDQTDRVLRKIRNHGESVEQKFVWETFGLNLRLTDVQAGIGLAQLPKLEQFLSRRNEIAGLYRERLRGLVEFQDVPGYVGRHPYMLFLVKVKGPARQEIQEGLQHEGIGTRLSWEPLHRQPVFRGRFTGSWPVAEDWGARGLCLPIYNGMCLQEAERVAGAVRDRLTA
jgi:dTDP-4-amino-4,6-dideoxygalactose transaminase/ribosomal protein S18 acetylase RimI-like enzyme